MGAGHGGQLLEPAGRVDPGMGLGRRESPDEGDGVLGRAMPVDGELPRLLQVAGQAVGAGVDATTDALHRSCQRHGLPAGEAVEVEPEESVGAGAEQLHHLSDATDLHGTNGTNRY